jgi:hypothetical protein
MSIWERKKGMSKMANITYQVTLSGDGKHAVSVTSDDPTEMSEALAWGKGLYLKLQVSDAPKQKEQEQPEDEPPVCPMHQVPMIWQQGRKGAFCHQKNPDGSWCSFRPARGS